MKDLVAIALAARVKDGELIGLGSGSTAELALEQIGARIKKENLHIRGVATSHRTSFLAAEQGIEVISPLCEVSIDWAFDGADEVDPQFRMIKGGGGAMLSEKIVAKRAGELVILVTEEKLVERLGSRFAVPVEAIPSALVLVKEGLLGLGAKEVRVREAVNKYGPVISEHGNLIVDARFDSISAELDAEICSICGVVDSGLFLDLNPELLIAVSGKDGNPAVFSRRLIDGALREREISL